MTANELDRLGSVEAKVDRILTILDDPDFGIRSEVRNNRVRLKSLEFRFYGLLAGVGGGFALTIFTLIQGGG